MTYTTASLAVSELLRAAEMCANSGNRAVRAAGVIHALRATGIAEGTTRPRLLTDSEAKRILALLLETQNSRS